MKIDASKRIRPRGERRPLHQRLTRQRLGQQRLIVGSILALVLVLAVWLAGLAWWVQLIAAGLGLTAGALWRTRRRARSAERWAFDWIEERLGLSYQTAVELGGSDAHGLGEAVRSRAARASTLEPPALQPWYIPPLLVTLLIILVPTLALPELQTPLGSLRTPSRSAPPRTDTLPTPDAAAQNPETRPNAPETGTAPDAARSTTESDTNRLSFETNRDAAQGAAQAQGEANALEQFLQQNQPPMSNSGAGGNMGEMTQNRSGQQQSGEQEGQDGGQGQQAGNQQGQQRQAQQPSEEDAQNSQNSAQQGQRPGQQAQGENRVQQASGASAQPQAVPPDEKMRNTGRTAQESERRNEQTSTEGVDMLQMRNSASQEKDNLNQMVREGEASERAGTGPGADIDSSRERLGGNTNQADRLTGERRAGRSTMERSAVLGQGQVPTSLPEVGTAESYSRANEEVIREGRIPAAYQNIVRDYFR